MHPNVPYTCRLGLPFYDKLSHVLEKSYCILYIILLFFLLSFVIYIFMVLKKYNRHLERKPASIILISIVETKSKMPKV